MAKIVVTGIGIVSPFGSNFENVWNEIYSGKSAIKEIKDFDVDDLYCKVAAYIEKDAFPFEKWKKENPKGGKFILYGQEAAELALLDASLLDENLHVDQKMNIGVILGSGVGGMDEIYHSSKILLERGSNRISPYFIPSMLINLLPGSVAIRHKIKGLVQSQVTACATGAFAIADGARMIRDKRCDVAVVGASEACIGRLSMAGFCALKALFDSKKVPDIDLKNASRPFDQNRAGFVMGEGAGVLILEDEEHAIKRGAKIYCEYVSDGLSCDAYNIVAPQADGEFSAKAMQEALDRGKIKAQDVGYINAHATSTLLGDLAELKSIKKVFANNIANLSVSSIKGSLGHSLGAAGAIEAAMCVLSLQKQALLPTINLNNIDQEAVGLDLVPNFGKKKDLRYVLSNSFGFGGHNIALLFGKYN